MGPGGRERSAVRSRNPIDDCIQLALIPARNPFRNNWMILNFFGFAELRGKT
jgi:hypothetical protein